jgi:hypothetical protein
MARAIVNSGNANTTEILQAFEGLTDPFEFVAIFVDNVEGVSYFGSILEFGTWLQDELLENYDAAWSAAVENILTCAVYCKIEPECDVSLDLIIDAYSDYISQALTLPDLTSIQAIWDWIEGIAYGSVADAVFVAAFHWAMWQVLRFGGTTPAMFLGLQTLESLVIQAEDETDTYCTSLPCDCAPEIWCIEWDFTVSQDGWSPVVDGGMNTIWTSGIGFTGSGTEDDRTSIYRDLGAFYPLTEFTVVYQQYSAPSVNWFEWDYAGIPQELTPPSGQYMTPTSIDDLGGGLRRAHFVISGTKQKLQYHIQASGDPPPIPDYKVISATLSGTGATPSLGGSPC